MDQAVLDKLADWLARKNGAGEVTVSGAKRLSGGAIQENWGLDIRAASGPLAAGTAYVLRTDAPSGVSVSHGRVEEFALLRAAFAAGVTVPEPLFCDTRAKVLGKPFYLMRRVAGSANPRALVRSGPLDQHRPALTESLGREIARLHSIRPPREDLGFLPLPTGTPAERRVAEFKDQLDRLPEVYPILEWGTRWLKLNKPPTAAITLCHGDYRTGNVMVDASGRDAAITGVLDWEFASWSDPLEDIGWLCARCWRFGSDAREVGGIGDRADLYRGYETEAGLALDWSLVPYWEVLATVRWAIIAHHQGQRHLTGEEFNMELALTGRKAAEMELDVLTSIRRIETGKA